MKNSVVLGIDIGGTGIKGALIDLNEGTMVSEKIKYRTPDESSPHNCVEIIDQIKKDLDYQGAEIGCGIPSIVMNGLPKSAANIDKRWIDFDISSYMKSHTNCDCRVINDADAAGLAEVKFGEGKDVKGTVIILTLGTGIGSGLFVDGKLVPNTEFGHLKWKDSIVEKYASNKVRLTEDLSWEEFGGRLNEVLGHIEFVMSPNLMILGGSVSKEFEHFSPYFNLKTKVVPAKLQNAAGIIGAAMATNL